MKKTPEKPLYLEDEFGGKVVTLTNGQTITIRAPKGRDLEFIEIATKDAQSNTGAMVAVLGRLTGQPEEDLWDLSADDLVTLGEVLKSFRAFSHLR